MRQQHLRLRSGRTVWVLLLGTLAFLVETAVGGHNPDFWKQIRANHFTVPPNESADRLAFELVDLTASTDPVLRDECGYEIFATWVYHDQRLNGDQLEQLRKKLLSGMIFQLGRADDDSIFGRSFSALFMSVLAAEDLQKPFLSGEAFNETLGTALGCYANEKDLRGYVPEKGWAHATAHVADLLKFLGRNPKLGHADQSKIVAAIAQRCRTAPTVFLWGEDARMAAALLSLVDRKDFAPSVFDDWFRTLLAENRNLWKEPKIQVPNYVSVRTQSNVLVQLVAKVGAEKDNDNARMLQLSLNDVLNKLDHPGQ